MDNPFQSPVILSFCTGGRMLERGLERAIGAITVSAYVEVEAFCIWNLVAQMEQGMVDPAPVWSDLKTFPAQNFYGKIHGIIGGYPCQPFSVAGKRKGEDDPRHLWPFIRSHIHAIRPVWCLFENVPGHLNLGYETVKGELDEMGYCVKEGIYSAEEVGAPHQRKRLFIFAIMGNAPCNNELRQWLNETMSRQQNEIGGSGYELADSVSERLQRYNDKKCTSICWNNQGLFIGSEDNRNRWPSKPGEPQQAWESPRVISRKTESDLGLSINGYNYREDLLRMLGNGVVEQTAEVAFMDLIRKHLNSK